VGGVLILSREDAMLREDVARMLLQAGAA
jgi:hypothetical protein